MFDTTKNFYEKHAKEYFDRTFNADLSHLWRKILDNADSGTLVLDLGCGSGRDIRHLSKNGCRMIGLDHSFNLLKLARTVTEQPLVRGDFQHLPFKDNSFDAIWAVASLLHVRRELLPNVLRELNRLLIYDGLLLTSLQTGVGEELSQDGRYFVHYQSDTWQDNLLLHGFETYEADQNSEQRVHSNGKRASIDWFVSLARKTANIEEKNPELFNSYK